MERKEYNGWTNYETWLCKLWMDQEGYFWVEDIKNHRNVETFAASIQEVFEGRQEDLLSGQGFFVDLVNAGMAEVDWKAIAKHLMENNEDYEEFESDDE